MTQLLEQGIKQIKQLSETEQDRIALLILEQLQESYQKARYQAAKQTGLIIKVFPEECLYSLELVLDEDWLPE